MPNTMTLDSAIARFGPQLANRLSPGGAPGRVKARTLRRGANALVFQMVVAGRSFAVKAFDPGVEADREACAREIDSLTALRQTGLVPRLLLASHSECFVVTEWQDGPVLRDVVRDENLVLFAHKLGQWYRTLDARTASRAADTTWGAYLANYAAQGLADGISAFAKLLDELPVRRISVAKNDAHLSNFLLRADGEIIGVDFAEAAMKPAGWDILLAARVIGKYFPANSDRAISALLDGWGTPGGTSEGQAFRALVDFFVDRTVELTEPAA